MASTTRGIRHPVLTDTANVPRDLGYMADDVEAWLARPRIYRHQVASLGFGTAGTLTTLVIPAQPLAYRAFIEVKGQIANTTTGTLVGISMTATSGAVTTVTNQPLAVSVGAAAVAATFIWYVDVAAVVATTLTFTSSSNTISDYRLDYSADVRYAAESQS